MKDNKNAVFRRQVTKSGNSYSVAIPVEIIEGMGVRLHQKVIVEPKNDGIFLKLVREEGDAT